MRNQIKKLLDKEEYETIIEWLEENSNYEVFEGFLNIANSKGESAEEVLKTDFQILGFLQYYYNTVSDSFKKISIGHMILLVSMSSNFYEILRGYQFAFSYLKKLYEMDPNNVQTCNAILLYASYPDYPKNYFTYSLQQKAYNCLNAISDLNSHYAQTMKNWREQYPENV